MGLYVIIYVRTLDFIQKSERFRVMKEYIGKAISTVKSIRQGDRIIVDNKIGLSTSVYKRSEKDKPYMLMDIDGGFKLTLIEVVLIVVALSVAVTLFAVHLRNKICKKMFKKNREK